MNEKEVDKKKGWYWFLQPFNKKKKELCERKKGRNNGGFFFNQKE